MSFVFMHTSHSKKCMQCTDSQTDHIPDDCIRLFFFFFSKSCFTTRLGKGHYLFFINTVGLKHVHSIVYKIFKMLQYTAKNKK